MRAVDRSAVTPPAVLTGDSSIGGKELAEVRLYQEKLEAIEKAIANGAQSPGKPAAFKFQAYSDEGVKFALQQLFHGKCAYCESFYRGQAPVDVEHYRPKNQVAGIEHPGYWWLAMRWDNLLPSCLDCNRQRWQELPDNPQGFVYLLHNSKKKDGQALLGKKDIFPVVSEEQRARTEPAPFSEASLSAALEAEQALLLDPTRDDPSKHIYYHLDRKDMLALALPVVVNGVVDQKGLHSIHVYGLNRLGLVQERTRILRRLEFFRRLILELNGAIQTLTERKFRKDIAIAGQLRSLKDQITNEIRIMANDDEPYCTLVRAWAKSLAP